MRLPRGRGRGPRNVRDAKGVFCTFSFSSLSLFFSFFMLSFLPFPPLGSFPVSASQIWRLSLTFVELQVSSRCDYGLHGQQEVNSLEAFSQILACHNLSHCKRRVFPYRRSCSPFTDGPLSARHGINPLGMHPSRRSTAYMPTLKLERLPSFDETLVEQVR